MWAASRSLTLKIFSWIFLKLIFPCLSLKKDPGLCSQPLGVLSLFFWKILFMRIAGWKGPGQDPSSARLCPSQGGPWVAQEGSDLELLLTAVWWLPVWLSLNSQALLCFENRDCRAVFFCVQCQIWWKCVFFLLLLLLLGLCQHHLSWPTTVSLSFPSALMWISSSITCDCSKCSVQPLCWLADFGSQAPSALKLALPCFLQLLL